MRQSGDEGALEIPAINPNGSTGPVDAPKALELIPAKVYASAAVAALPQNYLTTQLPAVENNIYLRTEGDVVRTVNLYLLHPLDMALQAVKSSISCNSEWRHGPSARTDIIWRWKAGDKWVTLGVLELKNAQLLIEGHFHSRVADMKFGAKSKRDPKSMLVRAFSDDAPNTEDNTFLGPSTSRVARQARKYHVTTRTDFVAVFDWCSMIIFDFGNMDESKARLAKRT